MLWVQQCDCEKSCPTEQNSKKMFYEDYEREEDHRYVGYIVCAICGKEYRPAFMAEQNR